MVAEEVIRFLSCLLISRAEDDDEWRSPFPSDHRQYNDRVGLHIVHDRSNPLSAGDVFKRIHTVFPQLKFDRNWTNMHV